MESSKFGIIIPTINRLSLKTALDSCLKQTYASFNVYVVFNGCEKEVVNEYLGKYDNRFHFLYSAKKGVSAARNVGLSYLVDEYFTCLDDDDELTPDALEIFNNIVTYHLVDMVFAKNTSSCKDKNLIDTELDFYYDRKEMLYFEFKGMVRLGMQSTLFRRIDNLNIFFNEEIHFDEDQLFKIMFTLNANVFCITNKITHIVHFDYIRRSKMQLIEYDKLKYTDFIMNQTVVQLTPKIIKAVKLRRANDLFYLLTQSLRTGLIGDDALFKKSQKELIKLFFIVIFRRKGIKGKLFLPFLVFLPKKILSKFVKIINR